MEDMVGNAVVQDSSNRDAARLLQQVKDFYADFSADNIARLDKIYTQDVEFVDPVHRLRGSLALKSYLRRMAGNLEHYHIDYLDQVQGPDCACLFWEMELSHKKLNGGSPFRVRGMSFLKFTGKVFYHEDCYDLGALAYERIPLLGTLITFIKRRMAG